VGFPTSQKSVGPASGKRNSSSALSQHVILGPSTKAMGYCIVWELGKEIVHTLKERERERVLKVVGVGACDNRW
jgi:hypothetical protein